MDNHINQKPLKKHNRLIINGYFLNNEKHTENRQFFLKNQHLLQQFDEILILERTSELSPFASFWSFLNASKTKALTKLLHEHDDLPQVAKFHYFPNELSNGNFTLGQLLYAYFNLNYIKEESWNKILKHENHVLSRSIVRLRTRLLRIPLIRSHYRYIQKLFSEINLSDTDVVIVFSKFSSGAHLLIDEARNSNASVLLADYGEIPGTFNISECGIAHKSWPASNIEKFDEFPVGNSDQRIIENSLRKIIKQKVLNKSDSKTTENILPASTAYDAVIYINGVEPFVSGLTSQDTDFSKEYSPHFSTNLEIIIEVQKIAEKLNWLVLYKDHPNLISTKPNVCIQQSMVGKHVKILENINVYDVITACDLVVTLGSKSAIQSLICDKPVVLLGPYSIKAQTLRWGLTELDADIPHNETLEKTLTTTLSNTEEGIDRQHFIDHLCRIIRYDLYEGTNDSHFNRGPNRFARDLTRLLTGRRSSLTSTPILGSINFPTNARFDQLWNLQTDSHKWQIYSEDEIENLSDIFEFAPPQSIVDWGCGLARSSVGFFKAFNLEDTTWSLCDFTGVEVGQWVDDNGKKAKKGMGTFENNNPMPYNDLSLTKEFCNLNGMTDIEIRDIEKIQDLGSPDLIYSMHCVGYHFSIKAFMEQVKMSPKRFIFGIRRKKLTDAYDVDDVDTIVGYRKRLITGGALQNFLIFEKLDILDQ